MTGHSQDGTTCTLDIISHSSTQTKRLGQCLGELLRGGELLLLDGQLGAGKTTFTQGLARGLNITETISSPTFTLLKEHPGQLRPSSATQEQSEGLGVSPIGPALYHFDLYRLDDPEEIIDLGFEDYFYGSGVCVVEWAEKADIVWPAEKLRIRMTRQNEMERRLLLIATGGRYCELLRQVQKQIYATTLF